MPVTQAILDKFNTIPIYIETGTDAGTSLSMAAKSGYKNITTIDIVECNEAKARVSMYSNIKFVKGDSAVVLPDLIKDINEQIVFYLDAHYMGQEYKDLPLIKELTTIAQHPIKNHVIIIDDVRLFNHMGINLLNLTQEIQKININYNIYTADDHIAPNDVLVCHVP